MTETSYVISNPEKTHFIMFYLMNGKEAMSVSPHLRWAEMFPTKVDPTEIIAGTAALYDDVEVPALVRAFLETAIVIPIQISIMD
jgi:hypothetical protein